MDNIEIYVATHKQIELNFPDYCKLIQVNAAKNGRWKNYIHDDDNKDNISLKNNSYCELTALYALWKNSNAQIKGLFHYRRYLSGESQQTVRNEIIRQINRQNVSDRIIKEETILNLLSNNDVILPQRNCPFPTTVLEDLQRFVSLEDIQIMIDTVQSFYPEYYHDLIETLNCMNISYCNMFIARSQFVDDYCTWLFDLLGEVEKNTNLDGYDTQHQRVFGYYSEILLNVFIKHNNYNTVIVHRVDLCEKKGIPYYRQELRKVVSSLIAPFGIYPIRPNRPLWEARYQWLTNEKYRSKAKEIITQASNSKDIENYFRFTGGTNILNKEYEDYETVFANFVNVSVMYFVCKTADGHTKAENRIDELRKKNIQFGQAIVYRIL